MLIPQAIVQQSGGGGLTQAYIGYNTIGASNENTGTTIKAKKVTISTACLITDIEAYIQSDGLHVTSLVVALFEDNAGAVGKLIQSTGWGVATNLNMSTTPRWYGVPLGRWVTAGDYWIAAKNLDNGTYVNIYYDTSGSDVTWSEGGLWVSSGENVSPADSTKKYSIRANTIS